jgi:hypothetical protein
MTRCFASAKHMQTLKNDLLSVFQTDKALDISPQEKCASAKSVLEQGELFNFMHMLYKLYEL